MSGEVGRGVCLAGGAPVSWGRGVLWGGASVWWGGALSGGGAFAWWGGALVGVEPLPGGVGRRSGGRGIWLGKGVCLVGPGMSGHLSRSCRRLSVGVDTVHLPRRQDMLLPLEAGGLTQGPSQVLRSETTHPGPPGTLSPPHSEGPCWGSWLEVSASASVKLGYGMTQSGWTSL